MDNNELYHGTHCVDPNEKHALLNYIVEEYKIDRFVSIDDENLDLVCNILEQQASRNNTRPDLIHLKLSSSGESGRRRAEKILTLLSNKGVVCLEGAATAELSAVFARELEAVFAVDGFALLSRRDVAITPGYMAAQLDLFRRRYFFEKVRDSRRQAVNETPSVAIVVLTYNHEKYIAACLESIVGQRGDFLARLIIVDDASSDRTAQIVSAFLAERCPSHVTVEFHVNACNLGVVKNLAKATRMATGCDYLTFCEGDDFWSADSRIQEHLDFLRFRPDCVMSFNSLEFCSTEGDARRVYEAHANRSTDVLTGAELAGFNLIGNFSACFYDGALLKVMPPQVFDMYTVDWMFNLYCSQFGNIGHLRKYMTVYRQHEGGEWSSRNEIERASILNKLCDEYNQFLLYKYNDGFQKYKRKLTAAMSTCRGIDNKQYDLIILDDVFPTPSSGFRYAEFSAYLQEFPSSLALVSGKSLHVLGEAPLGTIINRYQVRHPELGARVLEGMGSEDVAILRLGRLLYVDFLANAYAIVAMAEEAGVPFAFTLYPGGGFGLDNQESDRRLKRIFSSPCFRKVIVTQRVTYDYLVRKKLCEADRIEFIFGVVMPQDAFVKSLSEKKPRWGFGKKQLDICFMAHRYTPNGTDKGYDVFVNIASHMCSLHDNIYFHVIGPYDGYVININHIKDRVVFHGIVPQDKLDEIFEGMDIVISPNISGKIFNGSFDGFPTASCTEGGLRGVAIFCTDEFNSAAGFFVDKRDFVLIHYDLDDIVTKLDWYYHHPDELKTIGENGSERIKALYSHDAQIVPRIIVLRELIETPYEVDLAKIKSLPDCAISEMHNPLNPTPVKDSLLWRWIRSHSTPGMKSFYRKHIKSRISQFTG